MSLSITVYRHLTCLDGGLNECAHAPSILVNSWRLMLYKHPTFLVDSSAKLFMQSVTGRYRNLSLFLSWWILQWLYSGAWCCGEFMNDHVQALHILLNSCVMGWINHDCALQIYYRILYGIRKYSTEFCIARERKEKGPSLFLIHTLAYVIAPTHAAVHRQSWWIVLRRLIPWRVYQ